MSGETVRGERLQAAINRLRRFLKDSSTMNQLFEVESTDEDLEDAITDALDDWNSSAPLLEPVGIENHPRKSTLLKGAAAYALRSAQIWHERERLAANDGGSSSDPHDKRYDRLIDLLRAEYTADRDATKIALNVRLGLADPGIASPYAFLAGTGVTGAPVQPLGPGSLW